MIYIKDQLKGFKFKIGNNSGNGIIGSKRKRSEIKYITVEEFFIYKWLIVGIFRFC